MSKDKKINYLELPAKNIPAVKKFYASVFGWTFVDYGPTYTAFNDGGFDGGFYESHNASTVANGGALVVLYAEDLEAVEEEIKAGGGTICKEIFSFPGGRRFHFNDPAGNELAVWSDK